MHELSMSNPALGCQTSVNLYVYITKSSMLLENSGAYLLYFTLSFFSHISVYCFLFNPVSSTTLASVSQLHLGLCFGKEHKGHMPYCPFHHPANSIQISKKTLLGYNQQHFSSDQLHRGISEWNVNSHWQQELKQFLFSGLTAVSWFTGSTRV